MNMVVPRILPVRWLSPRQHDRHLDAIRWTRVTSGVSASATERLPGQASLNLSLAATRASTLRSSDPATQTAINDVTRPRRVAW
jgi:hypothetical protein